MKNLTYGPVRIIRGKYKNRIGYYDDDHGAKAIVYLGQWFDGYVFVQKGSIESFQDPDNLVVSRLWPGKYATRKRQSA
jgi:hypothetical protein